MGGLGMGEMFVIMVIALIIFGPRKLPEMGKTLGKAMGQFRRASEDFKRTWEQEVDIEKTKSYISDISSSSSISSNETYEHQQDHSYEDTYGYNAPSDEGVDHSPNHLEPAPEAAAATTETTPKQGQWI
jgi:sec-independent protein translocase protein TatA